MASNDNNKLKVFFIPFYATGHLVPFVDLAFLFAGRPDVEPTIVTTAANAAVVGPAIEKHQSSAGRQINLLVFPFPAEQSGLLPGQENISSIPYADIYKMCVAGDVSQDPLENLFRTHKPDAIVADAAFWWMPMLARQLEIPNVVFHVIGTFPQLVLDSFHSARTYDMKEDDDSIVADVAVVTDLPGRQIRIPRAEMPWFLRFPTHLTEKWAKMKAAQMESFGAIVNTMYGLEPEYCDEYRRSACRKAWFVGPTRLAAASVGEGGNCTGHSVLSWLDGKAEGSVVYLCFGSWCNFSQEQLTQIALGLEQSSQNFLWVVRGCKDGEVTGEEWIPEWWEERVKEKGIIFRGWAPQTEILGHKAVGAFMTQCGWNAVLEAVSAGVPILTWPLVFEQFTSERLLVEMLGVGVRIWEGFRSTRDEERVVVPRDTIGRAISRFMDGEGVRACRAKARELAEMARDAVAEGGTSWTDLAALVGELMEAKKCKLEREDVGNAKGSKIAQRCLGALRPDEVGSTV